MPPLHPLRRTFARYGLWAARHAKTLLSLSGALLFSLLYPIPFLYTTDATTITSGVSNLPHHVWTDARPLDDSASVRPDVVVRSVWVHGNHMGALDRDLFLGALELQDALLGPTSDFFPALQSRSAPAPPADAHGDAHKVRSLGRAERDAFHIINGLTAQSWFFQSPLQYWNGSADRVRADEDIAATINNLKTLSTSVNITLRHSTVFSGKRFQDRRLVAADALVTTLFDLGDSPVARDWVLRAGTLTRRLGDTWAIIPEDGTTLSSRLYEFQFRPLSAKDYFLITLVYWFALLYLLWNFSKVRAFKSRIGLMVTILAQIIAAMGSSLTACSILKVDLSRLPHYVYPLAVMSISLESTASLLRSVIANPSDKTSERIGDAFGANALIAIAHRAQNLLVLYGFSRITFPGVAAFCTFAAIAVAFDFFYLSTFFLAVLSVDVRQLEMSEMETNSLERRLSVAKQPAHGLDSPAPDLTAGLQPTLRGIRVGGFKTSTRVAGTILVVGFVLIAQAQYVLDSQRSWLNWLFALSWRDADAGDGIPVTSPRLRDVHQARSQTSWLRLQDHETAREVIKVIKPWAYSYVARVYEPITCVLRGAERTPRGREPYFLPAVYDFVHHEIPSFLVLLVMVAAMLLLLTDYLLTDQSVLVRDDASPDPDPLLAIKTLRRGHALDIAMITSADERLVSVGLDRTVQIWDARSGSRTNIPCEPDRPEHNPFPVLGLVIDSRADWVACLPTARVLLWSMLENRWGPCLESDLSQHKVKAFFFGTNDANRIPSIIGVRRNGTMVELQPSIGESKDYVVCRTSLVQAVSLVAREGRQMSCHRPIILHCP